MNDAATLPKNVQHPLFAHPLDNVIWQALTTRQANFAEAYGEARRFVREITSLCAFLEPTTQGFASLAGLVGQGGTAALFLDAPYEPRPAWNLIAEAPLRQMICEGAPPQLDPRVKLTELGPADSPEMVDLATLTKPGPFGTRTHELGTYLGIRREGKLVAMAGERLKVPGHTEISAVCTNPDHTGKGYAQALMTELVRRINDRGETPFLHVRQQNTRAVAIYEKLGFRTRRIVHFTLIRAA